jgi:hypothetical protein
VTTAPGAEPGSSPDGSIAKKPQPRFELPDDLTSEQERAVIRALERYFARESPHPEPWVLAGRVAATGLGLLQARRYTDTPWGVARHAPFARRGVPPLWGRGDAS